MKNIRKFYFVDICSNSSDASITERVLALVSAFPGRTSQELAAKYSHLSSEQIHKRLSDLEDNNLIYKSEGTRCCTISKKRAHTWFCFPTTGTQSI